MRAHKLRSFLAVLGVMIGVALIILVVGLVQGFRRHDSRRNHSGRNDTAWVSRFDARAARAAAARRKSASASR